MKKLHQILTELEQGKISSDHAEKQVLDLFAVMHSLPKADDNTYMQIINYGLQWGGNNPLGWKTGQDVVDYAKSKHQLFRGNGA